MPDLHQNKRACQSRARTTFVFCKSTMKSDSQETPFDSQMSDDLQSRRAVPTHVPVRIGPSASPADDSPVAPPLVAPVTAPPTPQPPYVASPAPAKEGVPMPVILGLAMALGAICVVAASIGMRRVIKPVAPVNSTVVAPPRGNVVMQSPELVIKHPTALATPTSPPQVETSVSEATPSVEISELPPITPSEEPTSAAPKTPRDARPNSNSTSPTDSPSPLEKAASPDVYPPTDTHRGNRFEITPPPGFRLRQSGRRTIWQRDDGAQILVETGKAGDGSPRAGWQKLDRDLARRYGKRYRSMGIHEGTLAGQPAAIWEFELTGKDGITRRKIDVGIKINGRGYAVLGAAPKDKFDSIRDDIEQALGSFRVSESNDSPEETENDTPRAKPRPRPRLRPTPEPSETNGISPLPQPESTLAAERGY